jgi:hypothetical protein
VPKVTSAPGGFDVTCTGVPDAPRTLKLGMLTLGKLKLGMLGSAPQPERAAQLSTNAIARRIVSPQEPLRRITYKTRDLRLQFGPLDRHNATPRCAPASRWNAKLVEAAVNAALGAMALSASWVWRTLWDSNQMVNHIDRRPFYSGPRKLGFTRVSPEICFTVRPAKSLHNWH